MTLPRHDTLPVRTEDDVARARQAVRAWAADLGLRPLNQTKIITATSELARNLVVHGGGGTLLLERTNEELREGLRLTFEDRGPGIPDLTLALRDGYTSAGGLGLGLGLGMGLGGARRLVDEFAIESTVGEGTRVRVAMWK